MLEQDRETGNERRGLACGALGLFMLVSAGPAPGQQGTYGIPPAASTQRALSDRPGVDTTRDWGLHASVGVSYAKRDNVRRVGEDGESDTALVITPAITYRTDIGRHFAQITAASTIARYDEFENEDFDNYNINGAVLLDVTRKLYADLYAGYTEGSEQRGASGTRVIQDEERDKVEIVNYGGRLTYGRRSSTLQLGVGAGWSEWRYQNNGQQIRDRDDDYLDVTLYYNVSPRTALYTGVLYRDIDYLDPALVLDSEETEYFVGASWEATARTVGTLRVGRLRKEFDDPQTSDYEGNTYAARLRWQARPRTGLSFYASRRTEETVTITDSFFVSELVGASLEQAFTPRVTGLVYYNQTDDAFESGRNDTLTDYGVRLEYAFRRWLFLSLRYSEIERDSNVALANYKDRIYGITLRGDFAIAGRR